MKRAVICMTATVFLWLSCVGVGLSEPEDLTEDIMTEKQAVQTQQPVYSPRIQQRRQEGELGFGVSHITYEEPDIMEEKGMMYGLDGYFAYHDKFMLKFDGRVSVGAVDYDGALSDGTPYTTDGITDCIMEFRGMLGYDFPAGEAIMFTPYAGLGYRYLYDGLGKSSYGYDRESNYFYSPIGVEAKFQLQEGWSITPTIEYDIFWHGLQISHYEDLDPAFDQLENDQEKGYGIRGSIKIQKNNFVIEPFITYWDIEKSEISSITVLGSYVVGYGWEPENNSIEIGCRLALKF